MILDEIENLPDVFNILLRFSTMALHGLLGRTVDFTNSVLIMTSNIGQEYSVEGPEERCASSPTARQTLSLSS